MYRVEEDGRRDVDEYVEAVFSPVTKSLRLDPRFTTAFEG